jgi:hypothetical protein
MLNKPSKRTPRNPSSSPKQNKPQGEPPAASGTCQCARRLSQTAQAAQPLLSDIVTQERKQQEHLLATQPRAHAFAQAHSTDLSTVMATYPSKTAQPALCVASKRSLALTDWRHMATAQHISNASWQQPIFAKFLLYLKTAICVGSWCCTGVHTLKPLPVAGIWPARCRYSYPCIGNACAPSWPSSDKCVCMCMPDCASVVLCV